MLLLANHVAAKAESPATPAVVLESAAPQAQQPINKLPVQSRGEMLYSNHCLSCHESIVHIREKHSARNLDALRQAVTRWAKELGLTWSSQEIEDVILYLNLNYYHLAE